MKRGFLIVFVLLLAAFAGVTLLKDRPQSDARPTAGQALAGGQAERNDQVRFWDYYNRATQYRIRNEAEASINYYRQALKLNPAHENSLYYLGNMQLALGRYSRARGTWDRLLEVNSLSARSHSQLGFLYSCNRADNDLYDLELAYRHFSRAGSLNREETGPLLQLAKIELIRGQHEAAGQRLDAITRSNFRSMEAYFLRGYLAWNQGRAKQSLEFLTKAAALQTGTDPGAENVGEGATGAGNEAMLSETMRCSFLSDRIEAQVPSGELSEEAAAEVYSRFRQEVERYKRGG